MSFFLLFSGLFCMIVSKCSGSSHGEEVTLLVEYPLYTQAEAVEWDEVNEAYYIMSSITKNVGRIEGSNLTAVINGDASLTYPFDMGNYTQNTFFPTGMYTDGSILYINDAFGPIILVDIEAGEAYDLWYIWNDISSFKLANLNGMCYDETNGFLYATDTGLNFTTLSSTTNTGMIYRINITDGSYSKAYNNSNGLIYPNGCIVSDDGMLYAIEAGFETPRLIIYNISSDSWDFVDAPARGDGIVFSNDGDLFITAFDVTNTSDGLYMISNESIVSGTYDFELVLSNLSSPADMDYNEDDSVLVFPALYDFVMYVVSIDGDENESTTTMASMESTMETTESTESVGSTESSESMESTMSTTDETDSESSGACSNVANGVFMIALIIIRFLL